LPYFYSLDSEQRHYPYAIRLEGATTAKPPAEPHTFDQQPISRLEGKLRSRKNIYINNLTF